MGYVAIERLANLYYCISSLFGKTHLHEGVGFSLQMNNTVFLSEVLPGYAKKLRFQKKVAGQHYEKIFKKSYHELFQVLSFSEVCVWIDLRLYANREGECFPSIRTLAKNLNCSVNTIQKALRGLVSKGHVSKKVEHGHCRFFLQEIKTSPTS
jgi:hypothetical protein